MKNIIFHTGFLGIMLSCSMLMQAQTPAQIYTLSAEPAPKQEAKVVSIETSCSSNATIFIENLYWQVHVKTSKHNKVKLETTITPGKNSSQSDAEIFAGLHLSLKGTENQVVVKSDNTTAQDRTINLRAAPGVQIPNTTTAITGKSVTSQAIAGKPVTGQAITVKPGNTFYFFDNGQKATAITFAGVNVRRSLTVYIPSGANLEIESRYGDILIENDVKQLKAYVNNASLSMKDVAKAVLRTTYVNISAGNIKDAEVDMANGRMIAGNLDNLVISSKSSDVEFHSCGSINIRNSMSDQYEIDQVATLTGRKDYGSLRISNVQNAFDITGVNGDIKIRHIEPQAVAIKINNRFADVRLPVSNLENYSVEYEGQLSNIYAPFDKGTANPYSSTKFKTVIGDSRKTGTEFQLKCSNCTIDFR